MKVLNRLAETRKSQGVTARTVSRNLGISIETVRNQENPSADLRISELIGWQEVLKVPLSELLTESEEGLSSPVRDRSRVVRLMRTALEIEKTKSMKAVRPLSATLIGQILEIMPELETMRKEGTKGEEQTCQVPEGAVQRL